MAGTLSYKALSQAGASSDSVQSAHGRGALSGRDWMCLAPLAIPANLGREPKTHTWPSGPVQGGGKQGMLNFDCQHDQGCLALCMPLFWSWKITETQGHTQTWWRSSLSQLLLLPLRFTSSLYVHSTFLDHQFYIGSEKIFVCVCTHTHTHIHFYTYMYVLKINLRALRVFFSEFHCDPVLLWATMRYFNTLVVLMSLPLLKLLKCLSQPPDGLAVRFICWEVGGKAVMMKKTFECYSCLWLVYFGYRKPFFSGSNIWEYAWENRASGKAKNDLSLADSFRL